MRIVKQGSAGLWWLRVRINSNLDSGSSRLLVVKGVGSTASGSFRDYGTWSVRVVAIPR